MIDQFGVQDVWVDGFTDYSLRNGIMRCTAYAEAADGTPHGVVRLIFTAEAGLRGCILAREMISRDAMLRLAGH
ncbi:MAG: hypothetical protein V4602_15105 [Pseudomonadota bacterium]